MTVRTLRSVLVAVVGLLAAAAAGPLRAQPAGFRIETVATGLDRACAMAFAPDGRLFVAERASSTIRVVRDGQVGPVWASVGTATNGRGEDGFLGIAVDPAFLDNGFVYVHFLRTSPVRHMVLGRFEEQNGVGTNLTILSAMIPSTGRHAGGPLVVGRDRKLYLTVGESAVPPLAQALSDAHGKVLRWNLPDGSIPADNPFAGQAGAFEWIWSYGHRNHFGLSVHPDTGDLYQTENGSGTGDELNRIVRGGNYGWPMYNGPEPVPDPATEDPLFTFLPEPALTGGAFYSGALYPAGFHGRWYVGGYNNGQVFEVDVDAAQGTVRGTSEFHRFGATFAIADAPDGNLWVLENETFGQGADRVVRFVHDRAPTPSLNVTAVSNVAIGGALTLGLVGQSGDTGVAWLSPRRLNPPIATPFGLLEVPPDLALPTVPIGADRRGYVAVPIRDDPGLRGATLWAQGATVQGTTIRLTNADSYVLH